MNATLRHHLRALALGALLLSAAALAAEEPAPAPQIAPAEATEAPTETPAETPATTPEAPSGLTLDGLLRLALDHDGRVRAAYARLDAFRAQYDEARWAWFPQIKLQALFGGPVGARRLKPCPASEPDCIQLELEATDPWGLGSLSDEVSFAIGGKLEAVLPLYTFGKITEAKRAGRAGVEAGEADIERARQEVAREVRRAWTGWQLARLAVAVLEDGESKLQEAERKLRKMLDELNEEVTDRDLFKLRYYASEVYSMMIRARQGRDLALAGLRFLTGMPRLGEQPPLAEAELEMDAPVLEARERYLVRAEQLRPELRMLRAAVEATRALAEVERAQLWPDFFLAGELHGSYSPAHDYISNSLLNNGLTTYGGGLSLGMRWTFDVPQKLARLERAEAERSRIEAQYEQAREAIGLEIDQRLGEVAAAVEATRVQQKGHKSANSWLRANWMSYGVGISNTRDLLDSLAAYARSKMERDRAAHDLRLALDGLRAAIGEDLSAAENNP